MPRQQGRVAMVMKDGAIAYSRDGRTHKHGFLGGGLLDAVRGVPQAERAARTYRSRMGWGALSVLGGALCSTTAMVLAIDPDDGAVSDRAAFTSLACAGVMLVGTGVMISGVPYQYDAVNIFNDTVPPVGPVHLPGQAPPLGAPGTQY